MEWLDENSALEKINLEHAGESFSDDTPRECADRLLELRKIGYHVPQFAIDALIEEACESDQNPVD